MQFVWRTTRAMARQLDRTRAVLFDLTGTLVWDDPADGCVRIPIEPTLGAAESLRRVREAGMGVGVVGLLPTIGRTAAGADQDDLRAAVEATLGPFAAWQCCTHRPGVPCRCRRQPAALVLAAARDMGVPPDELAVIGDTGTDLRAAQASGAAGILVPSPHTLQSEIRQAPLVAGGIAEGVDWVLHGVPHAMATAR